jgi:hypothetical protein
MACRARKRQHHLPLKLSAHSCILSMWDLYVWNKSPQLGVELAEEL